MLTHIHLDHAGASGVLVRRFPRLKVYVHERGAPHLIDPSKLMKSAAQLYGDDMDRLWGEMVPVPAFLKLSSHLNSTVPLDVISPFPSASGAAPCPSL